MAETEQPIPQAQLNTAAEAASAVPAAPAVPAQPTEELEPLRDVLRRRVTTIKEGDNVLLKLPSEAIKAVVASKDG
jgi:tRNA (adenine-N(1)-)-methyltransferase non-catalytic subunit